MRDPFVQAARYVKVGVIDLRVVFEFARPFEARIEGLAVILVGIAMSLQKLTAALRKNHGRVATARNPNRLDQPLFAKISEVA